MDRKGKVLPFYAPPEEGGLKPFPEWVTWVMLAVCMLGLAGLIFGCHELSVHHAWTWIDG